MGPERQPETVLLSCIEDASLNASASPQQRWVDGWLVRYAPGQVKRARSIQAVAEGRLGLDHRLALAARVYADAGLPMVARITPFSCPPDLDAALAERGWRRHDDTLVMVRAGLPPAARSALAPLPPGLRLALLGPQHFAQAVGQLRGSPPAERAAHGDRLSLAPVPLQGHAIVEEDGSVLACGLLAREFELAGLYDLVTAQRARRRGLATWLCEHMLSSSIKPGNEIAYLQVGADNPDARRLYRRLGFADAYPYHYRTAP
ncbi:MAG: GNAT family N-acetyltransferase [Burkholderiales bacterium]|nr:GNAT family N-acetyltransferase [Burkholderiales bacterium]